MMLTPDFWCGFLATSIVEKAGLFISPLGHGGPAWVENTGFIKIYAITMLEGFILSFMLAMISFFAVIYLQARDRRKFLSLAYGQVSEPGNPGFSHARSCIACIYPQSRLAMAGKTVHSPPPFSRRPSFIQSFPCP